MQFAAHLRSNNGHFSALGNGRQAEVVLELLEAAAGDPGACPADRDGAVGFADVPALIEQWGPCCGCPGDLDGDGVVGFADVLSLIAAWGPCP